MVQRTSRRRAARLAAGAALLALLALAGDRLAAASGLPLPGAVVGLLLLLALLGLLPRPMAVALPVGRLLVGWIGLFVAAPAARALSQLAALDPWTLARLGFVLVVSTLLTFLAAAWAVRRALRRPAAP